MKKFLKKRYLILLIILISAIIIWVFEFLLNPDLIKLSNIERNYLKEKSVIKVGIDYSFAPYEFVDKNENTAGITIDILTIIAVRLGINFEFIPGTWNECLTRFNEGEVDILNNITPLSERKNFMKFTGPTNLQTTSIYVNSFVQDVKEIYDLKDRKIGFKKGAAVAKIIITNYDVAFTKIFFEHQEAMINALQNNEIDAFVDYNFPIKYKLFSLNINNIKQIKGNISEEEGCFAVHKDDEILYSILTKGLRTLSEKDIQKLEVKWIGNQNTKITLIYLIKKYYSIIAIGIVFILGVLIWNWFLYKKIAIKDREKHHREAFLSSIFSAADSVAFILTDADESYLKIEEFSPGAEKIFGYKKDEIIGKSEKLLHINSQVENFPKIIRKIRETKMGYTNEAIHVRKNGEEFPAISTIFPIFNENDVLINIMDVTMDITKQKQDQKLIEKQREQFSAFMDHFPGGVYIKDKNSKVIYDNNFNLLLTSEDITGKYPYDIFTEEIAKNIIMQDKIVFEKGYARFDENITDTEGNKKYLDTQKFLIEIPDQDPILGGISFDVTEKKNAEKEKGIFISLVETSDDFISLTQMDGTFIYLNAAGKKLIGLPKEIDITKYNIQSYLSEKGIKTFLEKELPSIQNKENWNGEGEMKNIVTGKIIPVIMNSFVLKDKFSGDFIAIATLKHDITDRKQKEKRLKEYREHLLELVDERTTEFQRAQIALQNILEDISESQIEKERINKQLQATIEDLESFTHSVSHDLRAPLRHVGGFANLLHQRVKGKINENDFEYLNKIETSITYMGQLIDALLNFSRLGGKNIKKIATDMDSIVHKIYEKYDEKNIEWEINDLGKVDIDPVLMQQVWQNLISNAVKFSSKNKEIKIKIGIENENENSLTYYIQDNGIGFSEDYKDKLFTVFQRLHSSSEYEGIGIGLSNVKKIINKHSGEIWATGEVSKGATFYFTLPKN